jgi:hypothetical protein
MELPEPLPELAVGGTARAVDPRELGGDGGQEVVDVKEVEHPAVDGDEDEPERVVEGPPERVRAVREPGGSGGAGAAVEEEGLHEGVDRGARDAAELSPGPSLY